MNKRRNPQQVTLLHERNQSRLASTLTLVFICTALAVVLFLLFPESAYQRFAVNVKTEAATIEYLRQLHRAQPTNNELSIALAKHLYAAGRYSEAKAVAGSVTGKLKRDAKWVILKSDFGEFNALSQDDALKGSAREQLLNSLNSVKKSGLTAAQLQFLASMYLQLEQPLEAAETYELLAVRDSQRKSHWLKESAKWFVAGGSAAGAIRINEQMLEQAKGRKERHALLLERAKYYEWSGQPLKAVEIYRQLHKEGAVHSIVDRRTIVYSQYFAGTDALRNSLLREKARRTLSDTEVQLLVDILEHDNKQPQQTANVLSAWLKQNGTHKTLSIRLAYLYWALGDSKKAVAVMEDYRRYFHSDLDSTMLYAQLEYENGNNEKAMAVLLAVPHKYLTRVDYWELLGELAWQQGNMPVAEMSYEKLYLEQSKAFYGERYFLASFANGKLPQAVNFILKDSSNLRHPALISQMLSMSQSAGHQDLVEALIALAEQDLTAFYDVDEFWPVYGRYLIQRQGAVKAEETLLLALKQAPESTALHYGLLWFYFETQNKRKLPTAMRLTFDKAVDNKEFWPIYAASYVLLDQPRKALFWFAKDQQQHADDAESLLYFAEILALARYTELADEVRMRVLTESIGDRSTKNTQSVSYGLAIHKAQTQYQAADGQWKVMRQLVDGKMLSDMSAEELTFVFDRFQQYYSPQWLLRGAHKSNDSIKISPYQRLYLALESNDLHEIDQLLMTHGQQGLVAGNKMIGLERLGKNQQSLNIALNELQHNGYVDELMYQRHAALMKQKYPRQFGVSGLFRYSNYLDEFTETSRLLWSHSNRWVSVLEQGYSKFESDKDVNEEVTLSGELQYRGLRREARAKVGYNYSPDLENFLFAEAEAGYWFTQRLKGSLLWQWQSQSYESEAFRLYGLKDSARAYVGYSFTSRSQIAFSLAHSEFKTRQDGRHLGQGLQGEIHYSYALLQGYSYSLVPHISAAKLHNKLTAPDGPKYLPKDYEGVSAGVRFSRGNVDELYPLVGGLRFSVDLGASYSEPSRSLGFNLDVSVATSVFGDDELSLYAGRNLIRNETSDYLHSVGVRYEYFFGK